MSFDKKTKDQINRVERINKVLVKDQQKMNRYLDQEGDGYMYPENENEKTLKINQDYLSQNLPKYNKDNIFNLDLNYGSYSIDYSLNGSHMILGGEKGHIAMMDWRNKNLECEINVNEKISAVKFLHNETMFAVAQRKRLFIYDRQGIELHSLEYHKEPKFLEFLPYHFLLVSGLKSNHIKYQDVSMGKIAAEIKTKSSDITAFAQNPYNAIIISGHSNGVVNMWAPNYGSESVIKILAHPNTVNSIAVDPHGYYLTTCGNDSKMKVWDLRNGYKAVFEYFNPLPASSLTISQKNLLAVSHGGVVEIWKDYSKSKQKEPYMKHHFKNNQTKVKGMKFINFEDFLGIGTNLGYSSIVVPGAGEPNFDTFENNPYQTNKQRQTGEVKQLLEKIPAEMITIDPTNINKTDPRSRSIIEKERKEEINTKTENMLKNQKKKLKMRLHNKEKHDVILKELNKIQQTKGKMRAMIEIRANKKNKEKEVIKNDVQVLKMMTEDFDPELYIKEKEDLADDYENDNDDKYDTSDNIRDD